MTLTREQVMEKVQAHLASEFELDPSEISAETRFKEDLDADSLDLYELVMELEDSYGVTVSREETTRITTVGNAVDFVFERLPA
jgi:acyl carrier protein